MVGVGAGPVALFLCHGITDSDGLGIRSSFRGFEPGRVVRDCDERLPMW